ncbi:replication factor c subunit 1 [Anaeramoeba flamelloides]|uniref:Replication factor c subunit 1 n=1 Tax=Anaeramoeba flamelloides TaxID=1746091 RepID=A0ABQ8XEM7_9EUKA|nr:replication factor c subunit 1 [Anaeramoeba flamelloides]
MIDFFDLSTEDDNFLTNNTLDFSPLKNSKIQKTKNKRKQAKKIKKSQKNKKKKIVYLNSDDDDFVSDQTKLKPKTNKQTPLRPKQSSKKPNSKVKKKKQKTPKTKTKTKTKTKRKTKPGVLKNKQNKKKKQEPITNRVSKPNQVISKHNTEFKLMSPKKSNSTNKKTKAKTKPKIIQKEKTKYKSSEKEKEKEKEREKEKEKERENQKEDTQEQREPKKEKNRTRGEEQNRIESLDDKIKKSKVRQYPIPKISQINTESIPNEKGVLIITKLKCIPNISNPKLVANDHTQKPSKPTSNSRINQNSSPIEKQFPKEPTNPKKENTFNVKNLKDHQNQKGQKIKKPKDLKEPNLFQKDTIFATTPAYGAKINNNFGNRIQNNDNLMLFEEQKTQIKKLEQKQQPKHLLPFNYKKMGKTKDLPQIKISNTLQTQVNQKPYHTNEQKYCQTFKQKTLNKSVDLLNNLTNFPKVIPTNFETNNLVNVNKQHTYINNSKQHVYTNNNPPIIREIPTQNNFLTKGKLQQQPKQNFQLKNPISSSKFIKHNNIHTSQLWTEKYRPRHSMEILGNPNIRQKIVEWLNKWKNNKSQFLNQKQSKKAILLSGPPGIGKTTMSIVISKELGFVPIEMNASDLRNKNSLEKKISEATISHNITNLFQAMNVDNQRKLRIENGQMTKTRNGNHNSNGEEIFKMEKRKTNKRKKKIPNRVVLIMDEVDGISSGDYGGMRELIKIIQQTKIPIICICNDRNAEKIRTLVRYCLDLKLTQIKTWDGIQVLIKICEKENCKRLFSNEFLKQLITQCAGDLRRSINLIQTWRASNFALSSNEIQNISVEHENSNLFTITQNLFKNENKNCNNNFSRNQNQNNYHSYNNSNNKYNSNYNNNFYNNNNNKFYQNNNNMLIKNNNYHSKVNKKLEHFFMDYKMIPLFIYENYLKIQPNNKVFNQIQYLQQYQKSVFSISLSDQIMKLIQKQQQWKLLTLYGITSTVTPAHLLNGGLGYNRLSFPMILGNISKTNRRRKDLINVQGKIKKYTKTNRRDFILDYLPVFNKKLLKPLIEKGEEGANKVIKTMNSYELDKEDWDSLLEISNVIDLKRLKNCRIRPNQLNINTLNRKVKTAFAKKLKQSKQRGIISEKKRKIPKKKYQGKKRSLKTRPKRKVERKKKKTIKKEDQQKDVKKTKKDVNKDKKKLMRSSKNKSKKSLKTLDHFFFKSTTHDKTNDKNKDKITKNIKIKKKNKKEKKEKKVKALKKGKRKSKKKHKDKKEKKSTRKTKTDKKRKPSTMESPRKSSRKSPRKSIHKSPRKSSRKSIHKSPRKGSTKSPRKGIHKSPRKSSRKSKHKSPKKNQRKRKSKIKDSEKKKKKKDLDKPSKKRKRTLK